MQWPLSSKQFLSFHSCHEDKPKTGFDSLASAGLVTITTTEIDSDHKSSYSGVMQKSMVPDNQGGIRYTVTTYPTNHPKTTVSPPMGGATAVDRPLQNMMAPLSPLPISAIPLVNKMPCNSPIVGTTDLRNSSKNSGAPAQLTIFYNGSVCVYDNVSADKAQAIMLLAGNGPPTPSPAQASMARPSILESFAVSHPPYSHRFGQSVGWSEMNAAVKQGSSIVVSNSNKVVSSGSVSATLLPSNTVPQFRRKSLARFLEKRKERVINVGPYSDKASPESNSSGSCHVTTVN